MEILGNLFISFGVMLMCLFTAIFAQAAIDFYEKRQWLNIALSLLAIILNCGGVVWGIYKVTGRL